MADRGQLFRVRTAAVRRHIPLPATRFSIFVLFEISKEFPRITESCRRFSNILLRASSVLVALLFFVHKLPSLLLFATSNCVYMGNPLTISRSE